MCWPHSVYKAKECGVVSSYHLFYSDQSTVIFICFLRYWQFSVSLFSFLCDLKHCVKIIEWQLKIWWLYLKVDIFFSLQHGFLYIIVIVVLKKNVMEFQEFCSKSFSSLVMLYIKFGSCIFSTVPQKRKLLYGSLPWCIHSKDVQ